MDGLHIFLVALLGVASCSRDWISGSVLETVRPGDNITLYCDCESSNVERIVWYRNCAHENQPSLVLNTIDFRKIPSSFQFVRNSSSKSFDLLIMNITDSEEGLYYCGTARQKVEEKEKINSKTVNRYSNISTRILFSSDSSETPHHETPRDCGVCWILLFSLCPAFAVLSSLLSSLLVYHLCRKTAPEPQADPQRPPTRLHQDEDVCYAALEIRQASQRPKKKKTQISEFSTYSAINTSRM